MFSKIDKFDKLPPGPKDSVPTDTISKAQPVGPDDGRHSRDLAHKAKHPGRHAEDAPEGRADADRADVSLRAVAQFIHDRLKALGEDDENAAAGQAAEKPVLSVPLSVQSRAAVAYRLAQKAAPAVHLAKRDDDLPVADDAGLDEETRLRRELGRVETLQAAGYDRIPVSEGQTFLEALELAYTALESRL